MKCSCDFVYPCFEVFKERVGRDKDYSQPSDLVREVNEFVVERDLKIADKFSDSRGTPVDEVCFEQPEGHPDCGGNGFDLEPRVR